MPHCQLYYHLVWSTRNREPWITPEVEPVIYGRLRSKAVGLGGEIYALNGVEDHVHMIVSIPPRLAVSTFVGQLKGVSSAWLNRTSLLGFRFAWQSEYGAYTIEKKRLRHFVAYVESQKERHADRSLVPVLEPPAAPSSATPSTTRGSSRTVPAGRGKP